MSPVSGVPPTEPDVGSPLDTPDDDVSPSLASVAPQPAVPSLRPTREAPSGITASSTHLGQINAARRGAGTPPRPLASMSAQSGGLNQDILAKMKAFSLSRQGAPAGLTHASSTGAIPTTSQNPVIGSPTPVPGASPTGPGGSFAGATAGPPPHANLKNTKNWSSTSSVASVSGASASQSQTPPKPGGLAAKRMKPGLKLSDAGASNGSKDTPTGGGAGESAFSKYSDLIDTKAGTLNFKNKALIHGGGIEFSSGHSFNISLDEVDRLDELGKGNYGTVYKVRHSRPQLRKPGLGLSGIVSRSAEEEASAAKSQDKLSGVVMAMKEIRLELDEKKFSQIIMELDILHRCISPFIIDFYGAFFQEGAVYICVEYMDGGSIDKLYKEGVPENILRKVALSTVMGLKSLKDEHNIIHRDVKPTNILINTNGQIKICDFGVSGNLVASIAKTNIGCQSYMAPERIAGGGSQQPASGGGTYSVQSDIWSLGLSIIECAIGRYPYPPETFNNIFSQLHVSI